MELRDIEIFLALAEELHFGRTAERLHITPSRPNPVYLPDAPPSRWAFAWHAANTNPLIRAFADPADTVQGDVSAEESA